MNKPYKENTILFPLFVLLTLLCLFIMLAQAFAEPDDNFIFEERKDNQWTIDKAMMPNDVLVLSVNGQVTHGDRLQYRMMNNCNSINNIAILIICSYTLIIHLRAKRTFPYQGGPFKKP